MIDLNEFEILFVGGIKDGKITNECFILNVITFKFK
jgi:hypothetical protein